MNRNNLLDCVIVVLVGSDVKICDFEWADLLYGRYWYFACAYTPRNQREIVTSVFGLKRRKAKTLIEIHDSLDYQQNHIVIVTSVFTKFHVKNFKKSSNAQSHISIGSPLYYVFGLNWRRHKRALFKIQ